MQKGSHCSEETKKKMSEAKKGERSPFYGKHLSEEHKKKISNTEKGKKISEETRKKISRAMKGKRNAFGHRLSEEHKRRISEVNKGNQYAFGSKRSDEQKRKMSEIVGGENNPNYGKRLSEEQKRKISTSLKGYKHSEETKRKISKATKGKSNPMYGKHLSIDARKKLSKKHKGKTLSEETKRKMSKVATLRIQNNPGPFKDTKPELKMKEILNDLNIPFKHQFRLKNHLFDFHILNTNILIEVDGDYWHGNLKKFSKLNKRQVSQRQRDIENKKLAISNEFILLRFWQSDILNNEEIIKNKLVEVIKQ